MTPNETYDAVVIGGGAIGASVAYHLCLKELKVALVDSGDIGSGSSSHCDSCAQVSDKQPGFDTEQGLKSVRYLRELAQTFDYDVELKQTGTLMISDSEAELNVARKYVDNQHKNGVDFMNMVEYDDLHKMEPNIRKDIPGAHFCAEDTYVNPYKLCFAYIEEAKKRDLKVFLYEPVTEIKRDSSGKVCAVVTSERTFFTDAVFDCCGVWAPEIGKMVGLDIPVIPRKGVILITEATLPVSGNRLQEFGYMAAKFGDTSYERIVDETQKKNGVSFSLEQTVHGNLFIGSSRLFHGFDTVCDMETVSAIARRAVYMMPCLRQINCMRCYAGVRPFVEDHFQILSNVPEVPGFYIAAGHEGDGISLSAIHGKVMAQLFLGEETDLDISRLSFSRFSQNT